MRRLFITCLLALAACTDSTAPIGREPTRGFVTVAADVKLEYIDYGGSGYPLVLLAGLGNTAHVFESFVPRLSGTYRVIAITRRGFGASTQASYGYDTGTLAEDIRTVLDSLRLSRVHVVGHSLAGDEMTRLALDHADRIGKLVFLDAAYDRTALGALIAAHPFPAAPPPGGLDLVSSSALGRYLARIRGITLPDAEVRATYTFDADGSVSGEVTPPEVLLALLQGIEAPEWTRVRTPSLAVYAVPQDAGDVLPWLGAASPGWASAQRLIRDVYMPFYRHERERFRASTSDSRVLELPGANHYVFLSDPARVAQAIRDFLGR
ncbi:MAG: alpha/beta hydrolase [Gemmatimonadaceae bacterium]|nr:alpha/beta hydrolase [Gemmatimonadaceae bacterium]